MLTVGGALVSLVILLLFLMERLQEEDPIPSGRIIYNDLNERTKAQTLYSEKYGISGKPDLIIKHGRQFIPIEIKNMRAPEKAYEGHVAQLMAYCLLVEENFSKKPKFGVLEYRDKTYEIAYTLERKMNLISTIKEMRKIKRLDETHREHETEARCVYCGFRDICRENLCPQNEK